MLATKRVFECDRIPSLQRNGQPLKQELCLTWFLCNPCYSSTQLRDKLQYQLVPCATRLDCDSQKQELEWLAFDVWYVSKGPTKSNFITSLN